MRIAYVHTGLWPFDSPGATFTRENAVALAGEFDQCSFLVKRNHESPPEQVLEREFGMTMPPRLRMESTRPRLSMRKIVDDGTTGVFFTSESVAELADRIDELWPDEGARARMSRSIYDTCTKYLWSERARSLATTIRELKES